MKTYTVFYWKDPSLMLKLFLENYKPTVESLTNTHTELGTFNALDKEELFHNMQAETMTPNVLNDVRVQGPSHTSMSMGDVVKEGPAYFVVDVCGFTRVI